MPALIPASQVPGLFPESCRPSHQTVYRWISTGARGRTLPAIRIGGRHFVSAQALTEFIGPGVLNLQEGGQ